MKRQLPLALVVVGSVLTVVPLIVFLNASASSFQSKPDAPALARFGDRVTTRAQGRGATRINLADGYEVLTDYAGNSEAQRLLRQNSLQPLAMASADFDEDGVADLVDGYAAPNGGVLTIHRGNVDAIYPNTPEAQRRKASGTFTQVPFLSPARAFETPRLVDFIGTGDFDADGHQDILTAARGGRELDFFLGDGKGNLSPARTIELLGTVTALVTGEINRADGLTDLVVGIAAANGPQVLVFESPDGALRANPEAFGLPAVANAIALGRLDDDYTTDLVVTAGSDLMVVYGRDRKLSLSEVAQMSVPRARIGQRSLGFAVRSIALGDFKGDQRTCLSLLTEQGTIHLLSPKANKPKTKKETNRIERWKDETLGVEPRPLATTLVRARISSGRSDSLVIVDSKSEKLHVVTTSVASQQHQAFDPQSVSFEVEGRPLAVLPMRLNVDALSDLVILRSGGVAPSVAITSPALTFTVTSADDGGAGTLREAILVANEILGPDIINFSIGSGAQTINLQSPLPLITQAVTIDGTTQPGFAGTPLIELNGAGIVNPGPNPDGLTITDAGCTIRGLVINRFLDNNGGIVILGANTTGTLIEGNFIGTNVAGTAALANFGDGVLINGAPNTVIGGTTTAARNLISGNGDAAVFANGVDSSGTLIQGNFMGTDVTGTFAVSVPDDNSVVLFGNSSNNTIGGTAPGARNVISGSADAEGVEFFGSSTGNIVQGNFIGTNASGTAAIGNFGDGVRIPSPAANNLVGGTTPSARNVISGNGDHGVDIQTNGSGNLIQGNFIGTNAAGTAALGNAFNGVQLLGPGNAVGGADGAGNTIAFNGGDGVLVTNPNNAILSNSIFSNGQLGIDLGPNGVTPNDVCDGDGGGNNLQNFPVLTSASSSGGNTTIVGTLNSTSVTTFTIEYFSSTACDPSGNGEGQTFIGATTVATGNSCVASINATFPVAVPVGSVITATATDPLNNTSEFSQCVTVAGGGPVSDLQITKSDSPDPVLTGSNITYSIVITNNGPATDLGGTFTDILPSGTTFVSITSPGSCNSPPVGSTGTVSCSLGILPPGQSVSITLVVKVTAPPGATITNTATVAGLSSDSNPSNNSATAFTDVESEGGCTLHCPSDLFVPTSPSASSCGAVVTFSPTSTGCGTVTCVPPSGSVFAVGSTTVSCSIVEGPSCSFNITVVDETPPSITCTTGVTVPLPAGQSSAVVNYPAPTATDNCTVTGVACVPPSGSTFPVGSTLITCTARDAFENLNRCFFFVTVLDAEPPVIRCPANVSVVPPAGQTSAIVTYPAPTVSDNFPGTTVECIPPSGSSFSTGTTTVTCTATDARGNRASCSFQVGVGAAQVRVTIPGNRSALEFDANPTRKSPKPKKNPCAFFTIENIGFAPLSLTFDSIKRTGTDVTSGRISDPNDANSVAEGTQAKFFTLYRVNADQSLTQLSPGEALTVLQPGQTQLFCLKFAALIPNLAGKTTGLAASDVLPNLLTSTITFRQNSGANVQIPIVARVSTGVVLVNLTNRRAQPEVLFTRSGNEITVEYGVFDSNLDVTRAKYEFLDGSGQVIAGPFEIDLTASIASANLVRGQSFRVDQKFTGASSNQEITSVRVTVFDGESNSSATSTASAASINTASIQSMSRARNVTLYPPSVGLK